MRLFICKKAIQDRIEQLEKLSKSNKHKLHTNVQIADQLLLMKRETKFVSKTI